MRKCKNLLRFSKQQWAWSFYDWANSVFTTTVISGFFPIFFKKYYAKDLDSTVSTAYLGYVNAISLIFVVIAAPMLGALADQFSQRKKMIFYLALLGSLSTFALGFLSSGSFVLAVLFFGIANFAFSSSAAPYDSLLTTVATEEESDRVSALGYSMGYLGGGIMLAINLLMYQKPEIFGFHDSAQSIKGSFVLVAIWWMLFTFPLMKHVPESGKTIRIKDIKVIELLKSIGLLFRANPHIKYFLIAFFLYNDGVGTVARMAIDYGLSIGLSSGDLLQALLIIQFVAFPATLLIGHLCSRFHPKKMILLTIFMYVVILLWASVFKTKFEFYCIVILLGSAQGGIQSLSRSFFVRLIPADQSGQYFGIYNILGKFSGIAGSALLGTVTVLFSSHRLGIASVVLLFVAGAVLLFRVPPVQLNSKI